MGFLTNIVTVPFKVASGTVEGAMDIFDIDKKDEKDLAFTICTLGTADIVKGTLKGTKKAVDDIAESEDLI